MPLLLVGHQLAFNSDLSPTEKEHAHRDVLLSRNLCTIKQQVINASIISLKVRWVNWVQIRTCEPRPTKLHNQFGKKVVVAVKFQKFCIQKHIYTKGIRTVFKIYTVCHEGFLTMRR